MKEEFYKSSILILNRKMKERTRLILLHSNKNYPFNIKRYKTLKTSVQREYLEMENQKANNN
jgi:hypothetical protein